MPASDDFLGLLASWHRWAGEEDRTTEGVEGWQRAFPDWYDLIGRAGACMMDPACFHAHQSDVEFCWAISDEVQEMADYAAERLPASLPVLTELARSDSSDVRWQAYAALAEGGPYVVGVLLRGLEDPDSYARRRATLALAGKPVDVGPIVERLLVDDDPYMRQAATELALHSSDGDVRSRVLEVLGWDPVDHVRRAAERLRGV